MSLPQQPRIADKNEDRHSPNSINFHCYIGSSSGMTTNPDSSKYREAQFAKAEEERRCCTGWLMRFLRNNEPKFLTKSELCQAAMVELKVSKNSFNAAWINAIEETGRHDWYKPLPRHSRTKN
jgi:hypothetical protein